LIPLVVPGWGAPVVNVLTPNVRLIADLVMEPPAVTTVTVPKPSVLETATSPTVTPLQASAQVMEHVPAHLPAILVAK